MKKILLLMALVSFTFTQAQDTCATALPIGPGTQTVAAIDGTEVPVLLCDGDGQGAVPITAGPAGEWYLYTATIDGVATVSTDLPANAGGDTRLHVYTGTCSALVCAGGDDDVSTTNYLSSFSFPVSTGDAFLIAFDNRWSSNGFNFEITETPIACVVPTALTCNMTDTSATLLWTSNDNETLWNLEYGAEGFTQGAGGTLVNGVSATSYAINSLPSATAYDFYVQADCGAVDGLSTWNGPFTYKTLNTPTGCGLNVPSNNFQNGSGCQSPVTQANDITVPMGQDMTIAKITPSVMVNNADTVVSVTVTVYSDNSDLPGAVVATQAAVIPTSTNIVGTAFTSFNVTELELDLTPIVLAGSTSADVVYWIGISVVTTDSANNCFWETTTASKTGFGMSGSADGIAFPSSSLFSEGVYNFEATCSATATIKDDILSSQVSVYPTAVENVFTLNNQSNIALTNVSLFDMNGRVVLTENLDNLIGEKTINISNLATGMYFVEINSANAKTTKKIIKK